MRRWLIGLIGVGSALTLECVLLAAQINGYFDFFQIATPSNPASGQSRVYIDSTAKQLKCLNSDGSSCAPSGGGGASVAGLFVTSSGSSWGPVYPVTVPLTASHWTSLGTTSSLADISGGGLAFQTTTAGSPAGQAVAVAGSTWTATVFMQMGVAPTTTSAAGVFCADNAGNATLWHITYGVAGFPTASISTWTGMTNGGTPSFNGVTVNQTQFQYPWWGWMQMQVDATHRTYRFSQNGINWQQFFQESNTAFVNCTKVGYEGFGDGSTFEASGSIVSWTNTTP